MSRIKFKALEPRYAKNVYVDPVTNTVHLFLPIVAGTTIGRDNTCQATAELKTFFVKNVRTANSAVEVLESYRDHLKIDLLMFPEAKKQARL